ncbi:glycosyltransferase [Trichocoleus desertorum AS-A10]|uniref:glycosyltransferase family 2 protein n=1 Tax=Trichocoleus desertorum TaxID=1481672 RepID=UPI00329A72EE
MSSSSEIPKLSIVTPSFNQSQYIEETIDSVLSQNHSNLEYIIIDGGSTDGSWDIIKKYEESLHYCFSGSDHGQYDAINNGFQHSTGDIMAWLNSDDMYTPWAFQVVSEIFSTLPQVEWLTTLCPIIWNDSGTATYCGHRGGYNRIGFMGGEYIPDTQWFALGSIQQESVFWRRSLWDKAGGKLNLEYPLASDFELWARFYQHADLYTVDVPLGGFRLHGDQRSINQAQQYAQEVRKILAAYGGHPANAFQGAFRKVVKDYIRLPHSVRKLAVKLSLKAPHHLCVYSYTEKSWRVEHL